MIARCPENGIHVLAYVSTSNIFHKSAYRDDRKPRNTACGCAIPMFYAGPSKTNLKIFWDRRLADAREPDWRAYLMKKAGVVVDAGVDAIMWDNMIGYNTGLQGRLRRAAWPILAFPSV